MDVIKIGKYKDAAKDYMKFEISPMDVTLGNIPVTMERCYVDGFNKASQAWEDAFFEFCKEMNIPVGEGYGKMLRNLNKAD